MFFSPAFLLVHAANQAELLSWTEKYEYSIYRATLGYRMEREKDIALGWIIPKAAIKDFNWKKTPSYILKFTCFDLLTEMELYVDWTNEIMRVVPIKCLSLICTCSLKLLFIFNRFNRFTFQKGAKEGEAWGRIRWCSLSHQSFSQPAHILINLTRQCEVEGLIFQAFKPKDTLFLIWFQT